MVLCLFHKISSIPPLDLDERGRGQDKNAQEKWQVQNVLGAFPRCLWSFPRCLWPGEKNDETCASGGDLLKGLLLQKKEFCLHFCNVLLLFY